jgi:4-hydroxybenzoate polyprenyltransferase
MKWVDSQRIRDWLQLVRLPNVFTALADPIAGGLAVGATWRDVPKLLAVTLASAGLYSFGMVLNDWYDYRKDLKERPGRPLPSGRIRRWEALAAAFVLMLAGAGLSWLAGPKANGVAVMLIATIVMYDVLLKEVPIAPAIMGLCRAINLLMGMTAVTHATSVSPPGLQLWACLAMGVYVCGITIFARREVQVAQGRWPVVGAVVSWIGAIALAMMPVIFSRGGLSGAGYLWAAMLLGLVGHRMALALWKPEPAQVQAAVRMAILGIILFDAALVGFTRGLLVSLPLLLLLVPAVWLGKWLYST